MSGSARNTSVVTSKAAMRGQLKTGHIEVVAMGHK